MNLKASLTPLVWVIALSLSAALFSSCAAKYDSVALNNAVNLKTKTSALMAQAVNPYGQFSNQVDQLMADLTKAQDHATGTKNNSEIAKAWEALNNEVLKPFFNKWQKEGALNQLFINESIRISDAGFDAIKAAEEAKPGKK